MLHNNLGGSVMNKKQWLGLGLVTVAAIGLAACGNRASKKDSANSESKTHLSAENAGRKIR